MPERFYSKHLPANKKVLVKGWVEKVRNLGGLRFFILRDREGKVQVTAKKGSVSQEIITQISGLNREDCIEVVGTVAESGQARVGKEVVPEHITIVNKAQTPLPLDIEGPIQSGLDKRFDFRFLDVRNPGIQTTFRIRDVVLTKMREYYESQGFVEVNTPVIQAAGAEGGATLFPLKYYGKDAFLRQSPQLYKQILMASGMDKVYEVGPAFRAEKFHTRRHVSEFLSFDVELAWIRSVEDVLKVLEQAVAFTCKETKATCKEELAMLDANVTVPELPLKRITYSEALDMLEKEGVSIPWGEDMGDKEENVLGNLMKKKGLEWYFIKEYPSVIKPFYIMLGEKVSEGFDLAFKGLEIASGGQREHRYDVLVDAMKKKGLDPRKFTFYLDAFRYGMPPHGGYGFGVERMIQMMLNLDSIKESILFPRTPDRMVP